MAERFVQRGAVRVDGGAPDATTLRAATRGAEAFAEVELLLASAPEEAPLAISADDTFVSNGLCVLVVHVCLPCLVFLSLAI